MGCGLARNTRENSENSVKECFSDTKRVQIIDKMKISTKQDRKQTKQVSGLQGESASDSASPNSESTKSANSPPREMRSDNSLGSSSKEEKEIEFRESSNKSSQPYEDSSEDSRERENKGEHRICKDIGDNGKCIMKSDNMGGDSKRDISIRETVQRENKKEKPSHSSYKYTAHGDVDVDTYKTNKKKTREQSKTDSVGSQTLSKDSPPANLKFQLPEKKEIGIQAETCCEETGMLTEECKEHRDMSTSMNSVIRDRTKSEEVEERKGLKESIISEEKGMHKYNTNEKCVHCSSPLEIRKNVKIEREEDIKSKSRIQLFECLTNMVDGDLKGLSMDGHVSEEEEIENSHESTLHTEGESNQEEDSIGDESEELNEMSMEEEEPFEETVLPKLPLTTVDLKKRITRELTRSKTIPIDLLLMDYSMPDKRAMLCPKSKTQNLKVLANFLIEGASSEIMKARAIFRWITENIDYDTEGFFSGRYSSCAPSDVLATRKSISSGYARLFKQMCDVVDVECVLINGWAKGYEYKPGESFENTDTNHAWNAIKLEGSWYLLDPTWGAGRLNQANQFIKEYNNYYWLVSPYIMIYEHFPNLKNWQLLESPLSMKEYCDMVKVRPKFFEMGLRMISHNETMIHTSNGKVMIVLFSNKPGIQLLACLHNMNDRSEAKKSVRVDSTQADTIRISLLVPHKGSYLLNIFVKEPLKDSFAYHDIIEYMIESHESLGGPEYVFPYFSPNYEKNFSFISLVSPELGFIKSPKGEFKVVLRVRKGRKIDIKVHLQDEEGQEVGKKKDSTMCFYRKDIIEILVHVPHAGTFMLSLFAAHSGSTSYQQIMEFQLESNDKSAAPFPTFYAGYEEMRIELVEPQSGLIECTNGEAITTLRAPEGVEILATLYNQKGRKIPNSIFMTENSYSGKENLHNIYCHAPSIGSFLFSIFAKEKSSVRGSSYTEIIKFRVESEGKAEGFPMIYGVEEGCLISPIKGELERGLEYEFRIFSKLATAVNLVFNAKERPLMKMENDIWYLKAKIPNKTGRKFCSLNMQFPDEEAPNSTLASFYLK